jgi:hypothetical protein
MLIADEFLRLGLAEMVDQHVRIGQQKRQRALRFPGVEVETQYLRVARELAVHRLRRAVANKVVEVKQGQFLGKWEDWPNLGRVLFLGVDQEMWTGDVFRLFFRVVTIMGESVSVMVDETDCTEMFHGVKGEPE